MAMPGLARPKRLIDITRIPELAFVRDEGSAVVIGATTRQYVLEHDATVRAKVPVRQGLPFVGHARSGRGERGRLARQRRSGGGDRARCGHARSDAGLSRR